MSTEEIASSVQQTPTPCATGGFTDATSMAAGPALPAKDADEGEVIDSRLLSSSLVNRPPTSHGIRSATPKHSTREGVDKTQVALQLPSECGSSVVRCSSSRKHDFRSASVRSLPRSCTTSTSRGFRDVGAPYRVSHTKRLRDAVADARDRFSSDERLIMLKHDNDRYRSELRAKCERLKELEVVVRTLRIQKSLNAPINSSETDCAHADAATNAEMTRLIDENMEMKRKLHKARSQLDVLKRDARVAHLQELKMDLAVYQSELARVLSSAASGTEGAGGSKGCGAKARLQDSIVVSREKSDVIEQMKGKLSETSAALRKALDDVTRAESAAEQLREENAELCKEVRLFRKTTVALSCTREELKRTQCELSNTRHRLNELERLMDAVGGYEEFSTVVRERDVLLTLLKEQNDLGAGRKDDLSRTQTCVRKEMEQFLQEVLREERAFAKDREVQLQRICRMWKDKYERLVREGAVTQKGAEQELPTTNEGRRESGETLPERPDTANFPPSSGSEHRQPLEVRYRQVPDTRSTAVAGATASSSVCAPLPSAPSGAKSIESFKSYDVATIENKACSTASDASMQKHLPLVSTGAVLQGVVGREEKVGGDAGVVGGSKNSSMSSNSIESDSKVSVQVPEAVMRADLLPVEKIPSAVRDEHDHVLSCGSTTLPSSGDQTLKTECAVSNVRETSLSLASAEKQAAEGTTTEATVQESVPPVQLTVPPPQPIPVSAMHLAIVSASVYEDTTDSSTGSQASSPVREAPLSLPTTAPAFPDSTALKSDTEDAADGNNTTKPTRAQRAGVTMLSTELCTRIESEVSINVSSSSSPASSVLYKADCVPSHSRYPDDDCNDTSTLNSVGEEDESFTVHHV
ncbi:hypothetical protein ERJ75_000045400 [Trypanosoma vivax]|nr:hypothetical protein ERJ75_000045400 [Trypanosoma vivax]